MKKLALAIALAAWLGAFGCLESNPQPSPQADGGGQWGGGELGPANEKGAGDPDSDLMFASAPDESETSVVVGCEGAAEGADEVYATEDGNSVPAAGGGDDGDARAGSGGDGFVEEDGSFLLVVPGIKPPRLYLHFRYPDGDERVVDLAVPELRADDDLAPWLMADASAEEPQPGGAPPEEYAGLQENGGKLEGIEVTVVDGETVQVTGGFLSVTPLSKVVVANLATGAKEVVVASTSGQFKAILAGQSGDTLYLFAVSPADSSKATTATTMSVP